MKKAVLVFNMPKCCIECPCLDENLISRTCGAMDEYTKLDKFEIYGLKPDWCPLKEMPEKDDTPLEGNEFRDGYTLGYNRCISKILGKCD